MSIQRNLSIRNVTFSGKQFFKQYTFMRSAGGFSFDILCITLKKQKKKRVHQTQHLKRNLFSNDKNWESAQNKHSN